MWNNIRTIDSSDQNVKKIVFNSDSAVAESVLYKYPTYAARTVICCSTQSGCPMGCRFCGAGDHFVRSLTAEEIVSQPVHLLDVMVRDSGTDPIDIDKLQIMFMSMGEPMLNYKALEKALVELHEKYPKAALLISTSGPSVSYDELIELSTKIRTIGLQFSVHESTDEARNQLIPFKNKLTLEQISVIGEKFFERTGRHPFFNYCAHDKNSSQEDVDRIYGLFNPAVWEATISVICERDESVAAANERQRELAADFMTKLMEKGYSTRMFDPAGQDDIGGGCGQLFHVQNWMKLHPDIARKSVGFGKPIVHMPTVLS